MLKLPTFQSSGGIFIIKFSKIPGFPLDIRINMSLFNTELIITTSWSMWFFTPETDDLIRFNKKRIVLLLILSLLYTKHALMQKDSYIMYG